MKKILPVAALLVAQGLLPSTAQATSWSVALTGVTLYGPQGAAAANLALSTATWTYDDVADTVSQTGGVFDATYQLGIDTVLFDHIATDLVIGASGPASATTFACVEGNFGVLVGASICGNYNFGRNHDNNSTTTWGPGTSFSRTMGGDDGIAGPQQSLLDWNGFSTVSWNESTLVFSNAPNPPTSGFNMTFTNLGAVTVPVPGAVWLFGSALGLLGVARRKSNTGPGNATAS